MKVIIVYNEPVRGLPDSEDVLNEISVVVNALRDMGYQYITYGVSSRREDIINLIIRLMDYSPTVIFNIVEDVKLSAPVTAVFEIMGFSYTGSPHESISITTNKAATKAMLIGNNILTPRWMVFKQQTPMNYAYPFPVILKPIYEDASVGIGDGSVISEMSKLMEKLDYMLNRYQQPILVEEYIDGREFNVSLLEDLDGEPEVLPVAEVVFSDWPEDKPKIVGYSAKWDNSSFEFNNTHRRFNPQDAPLKMIKDLSIKCWNIFNLKGYARLDMRMDKNGNLYIVEINANPCISPDAGFMASAREASYSANDVIERLLLSAMSASGGKSSRD